MQDLVQDISSILSKYILSKTDILSKIQTSFYGSKFKYARPSLSTDLFEHRFIEHIASNQFSIVEHFINMCITDVTKIVVSMPKNSNLTFYIDTNELNNRKILISIEELRYLLLCYIAENVDNNRYIENEKYVYDLYNCITKEYQKFLDSIIE